MLVSFSLENYKSFKEQQRLSFVSPVKDEHQGHILELENGLCISRFAAIIGGNGVGKTQLISAIDELTKAITDDDYSKLHHPFILDDSKNKETSYEFIILERNKTYFLRYGISVLNNIILKEYLYTRPVKKAAKEQCIFIRDETGLSFKKDGYKKHEKLLAPILKNTGSVLTFANSLEAQELSDVKVWAEDQFVITKKTVHAYTLENLEYALNRLLSEDNDGEFVERVINIYNDFITSLPLYIDSVSFEKSKDSSDNELIFKVSNNDGVITEITANNRDDFFSEGTMNVLVYLAGIIWSTESERTLYIDEIDSSVHYNLAAALINKIINIREKADNMQFVLSTHNIPLLDDCFRRDEVNIVIKDDDKSSRIENIAQFSMRKDAKISAKYFRNEFGSLPKILGFMGGKDAV